MEARRGRQLSLVTETAAGRDTRSTSVHSSRLLSTRRQSPSSCTLLTAFTVFQPSRAPVMFPTCWEYRSPEPSPKNTAST